MPPQTPYSNDLGAREPVRAMRETIDRIHALTSGWSAERFEWIIHQIAGHQIHHLAQLEKIASLQRE
jgi:hypothetical protein